MRGVKIKLQKNLLHYNPPVSLRLPPSFTQGGHWFAIKLTSRHKSKSFCKTMSRNVLLRSLGARAHSPCRVWVPSKNFFCVEKQIFAKKRLSLWESSRRSRVRGFFSNFTCSQANNKLLNKIFVCEMSRAVTHKNGGRQAPALHIND